MKHRAGPEREMCLMVAPKGFLEKAEYYAIRVSLLVLAIIALAKLILMELKSVLPF